MKGADTYSVSWISSTRGRGVWGHANLMFKGSEGGMRLFRPLTSCGFLNAYMNHCEMPPLPP